MPYHCMPKHCLYLILFILCCGWGMRTEALEEELPGVSSFSELLEAVRQVDAELKALKDPADFYYPSAAPSIYGSWEEDSSARAAKGDDAWQYKVWGQKLHRYEQLEQELSRLADAIDQAPEHLKSLARKSDEEVQADIHRRQGLDVLVAGDVYEQHREEIERLRGMMARRAEARTEIGSFNRYDLASWRRERERFFSERALYKQERDALTVRRTALLDRYRVSLARRGFHGKAIEYLLGPASQPDRSDSFFYQLVHHRRSLTMDCPEAAEAVNGNAELSDEDLIQLLEEVGVELEAGCAPLSLHRFFILQDPEYTDRVRVVAGFGKLPYATLVWHGARFGYITDSNLPRLWPRFGPIFSLLPSDDAQLSDTRAFRFDACDELYEHASNQRMSRTNVAALLNAIVDLRWNRDPSIPDSGLFGFGRFGRDRSCEDILNRMPASYFKKGLF